MVSVRRSTLSLICKCVLHLSNEGFSEYIDANLTGKKQPNINDEKCNFVENLMGVLVTVFNIEDDIEGKEQALLVCIFILVSLKLIVTLDNEIFITKKLSILVRTINTFRRL